MSRIRHQRTFHRPFPPPRPPPVSPRRRRLFTPRRSTPGVCLLAATRRHSFTPPSVQNIHVQEALLFDVPGARYLHRCPAIRSTSRRAKMLILLLFCYYYYYCRWFRCSAIAHVRPMIARVCTMRFCATSPLPSTLYLYDDATPSDHACCAICPRSRRVCRPAQRKRGKKDVLQCLPYAHDMSLPRSALYLRLLCLFIHAHAHFDAFGAAMMPLRCRFCATRCLFEAPCRSV